jgi:hypothetical protein
MQDLNTYKKQDYIILDGQNKFDLKNLKELMNVFDGYNKVIFYILLDYFDLPTWPSFIFLNFNDTIKKELDKFVKKERNYFVRTDSYNSLVANPSYIGSGKNVKRMIKDFKKTGNRFVIVVEEPDVYNITYTSNGSGRTGIINGKIVQEWVGPGFSEYHLAKDRFPDKCTVQHLVEIKGKSHEIIWNASQDQIKKDIKNLLISVAIRQLELVKFLSDNKNYRELTNKGIVGKEITQDELNKVYKLWKVDFSEINNISDVDKYLIDQGKKYIQKISKYDKSVLNIIEEDYYKWTPSEEDIIKVNNYLNSYIEKAKQIGILTDNTLLTYSIGKNLSKDGIVFWDIHNLKY